MVRVFVVVVVVAVAVGDSFEVMVYLGRPNVINNF